MTDFKLTDVKQVREASDAVAANRYLAQGWVLLGTSQGQDESSYPIVRYTLGWVKDEQPPRDY